VIIRIIKKDEIPVAANIWLAASKAAHDFIDSSYWQSKLAEMVEVYLPAAETYVAEGEDSVVVGFISILDGDNIAALFVDPSAQGRGVGGELIKFAQQRSSFLKLKVYSKNLRARAFYKKHGFVDTKEIIDSETGENEVLMEWRP